MHVQLERDYHMYVAKAESPMISLKIICRSDSVVGTWRMRYLDTAEKNKVSWLEIGSETFSAPGWSSLPLERVAEEVLTVMVARLPWETSIAEFLPVPEKESMHLGSEIAKVNDWKALTMEIAPSVKKLEECKPFRLLQMREDDGDFDLVTVGAGVVRRDITTNTEMTGGIAAVLGDEPGPILVDVLKPRDRVEDPLLELMKKCIDRHKLVRVVASEDNGYENSPLKEYFVQDFVEIRSVSAQFGAAGITMKNELLGNSSTMVVSLIRGKLQMGDWITFSGRIAETIKKAPIPEGFVSKDELAYRSIVGEAALLTQRKSWTFAGGLGLTYDSVGCKAGCKRAKDAANVKPVVTVARNATYRPAVNLSVAYDWRYGRTDLYFNLGLKSAESHIESEISHTMALSKSWFTGFGAFSHQLETKKRIDSAFAVSGVLAYIGFLVSSDN